MDEGFVGSSEKADGFCQRLRNGQRFCRRSENTLGVEVMLETRCFASLPRRGEPDWLMTRFGRAEMDDTIEVLGNETSCEVEPLLLRANGTTYFDLASDHTYRTLDRHSVAASKQA